MRRVGPTRAREDSARHVTNGSVALMTFGSPGAGRSKTSARDGFWAPTIRSAPEDLGSVERDEQRLLGVAACDPRQDERLCSHRTSCERSTRAQPAHDLLVVRLWVPRIGCGDDVSRRRAQAEEAVAGKSDLHNVRRDDVLSVRRVYGAVRVDVCERQGATWGACWARRPDAPRRSWRAARTVGPCGPCGPRGAFERFEHVRTDLLGGIDEVTSCRECATAEGEQERDRAHDVCVL